MEKIKNIALFLFLAVFVASLFFNVNYYVGGTAEPYRDTIRTTFVDTIPYYKPAPKDSAVIRHVTQRLPIADISVDSIDISVDKVDNSVDSVAVEIPITQKVYEDSAYTAWVSGYKPSLDSLLIYQQTQTITIIEREKPKRWHLGLTSGFAMTPKGFQPYLGLGLTFTFISF